MGSVLIDMTGMQVGRWFVLRRLPNSKARVAQWECRCECGLIKAVCGANLRRTLRDPKGRCRTNGCQACANKAWRLRQRRSLSPRELQERYERAAEERRARNRAYWHRHGKHRRASATAA